MVHKLINSQKIVDSHLLDLWISISDDILVHDIIQVLEIVLLDINSDHLDQHFDNQSNNGLVFSKYKYLFDPLQTQLIIVDCFLQPFLALIF